MAVAAPFAAPLPAEQGDGDFSLVLGGPLYQLFRRTRLADDRLGLLPRRILGVVLVLWAPLLALSAIDGRLTGPGHGFLTDVGFQLRFLVAAPLLVLAEIVVHRRLRHAVAQFRDRSLVREADVDRFIRAVHWAMRLRNAPAAEALLLVAVYALGGLFTLHRYETMGSGDAFGWAAQGGRVSPAGLWLVFVSLPLLQFLFLRWYYRLAIWAGFLWRVSTLDLDLNVTHPDRAAGLGFLGEALVAFVPVAAAHGVLFTGMIADRILYAGAKLTDFQLQVLGAGVLLLAIFAGPLLVFGPVLARVRRRELLTYGALAQTYVRDFREKWIDGPPPADEPLIGAADIQSLADLGNSYSAAEQTRIIPIGPRPLIAFFAAFVLPIAPLALTMMSAEELLGKVVGLVF